MRLRWKPMSAAEFIFWMLVCVMLCLGFVKMFHKCPTLPTMYEDTDGSWHPVENLKVYPDPATITIKVEGGELTEYWSFEVLEVEK